MESDFAPEELADSVSEGSKVKVVVLSGEVVMGEVVRVTEEEVVIWQMSEITRERVIEWNEIARIEIEKGTKSGDYVLTVLVVAAVAVVGWFFANFKLTED